MARAATCRPGLVERVFAGRTSGQSAPLAARIRRHSEVPRRGQRFRFAAPRPVGTARRKDLRIPIAQQRAPGLQPPFDSRS